MGEFVSIRASAGVRSGADTICGLTLPFMEGVVVASAVALCCRVSSSCAVQAPAGAGAKASLAGSVSDVFDHDLRV